MKAVVFGLFLSLCGFAVHSETLSLETGVKIKCYSNLEKLPDESERYTIVGPDVAEMTYESPVSKEILTKAASFKVDSKNNKVTFSHTEILSGDLPWTSITTIDLSSEEANIYASEWSTKWDKTYGPFKGRCKRVFPK